jgi:hypothetical protein
VKRIRVGRFAALAATLALAVPTVAQAGNEVTKWNDIAVQTVNAQPGLTSAAPAGAIFVAMVQGAVYGAVNAVDRHGRPYLINQGFPMAAKDAAAAAAAYGVLHALFPTGGPVDLDAAYAASLLGIPNGPLKDNGIAVGRMAADAMLAQGHDDRVVIPCPTGSGIGQWEGPLPGQACDPSPWVKDATPFFLDSPSQFRTPGPYALTSDQYTEDFNEVKSLGKDNSTTRNDFQTHSAAFWQTNPVVNYNALARRFVDEMSLDLSDSARLFAMIDLSSADAIITAWNDKYHYKFWRPIAAIRQAGADGNDDTEADPTWTPLFNPLFNPTLPPSLGGVGPALITPPYPDHVSGATTFASASMHGFASFFGTDEMSTEFYLTSSRFPAEKKFYTKFSDVTNEILEARIWAGIHFRNADVQAADLGRDVERYIHTRWFAAAH